MQVSFAFKAVFYVAISAVTFVSLIGNTLEIITFLKTQNLRTSTNYFITSMAVSDAISVVIHWVLYSRSTYSVFEPSMTFNELSMTMCKLSMFVTCFVHSIDCKPCTHFCGQIHRYCAAHESENDNKKNQGDFYFHHVDFSDWNRYSRVVLFKNDNRR